MPCFACLVPETGPRRFPVKAKGSRWHGYNPLKLSASARPQKRLPLQQICLPTVKARRKPLQHTTHWLLSSPKHNKRDKSSLMIRPENLRPHQRTCRPLMRTQLRVLWWVSCQQHWVERTRSLCHRDWRQLFTSTGMVPVDRKPQLQSWKAPYLGCTTLVWEQASIACGGPSCTHHCRNAQHEPNLVWLNIHTWFVNSP